jgi:hypothetical protein
LDLCGVRLLERDRHGAEPTIYGAALLKRGTTVFAELWEGVKDIEFLTDPAAGEVRARLPLLLRRRSKTEGNGSRTAPAGIPEVQVRASRRHTRRQDDICVLKEELETQLPVCNGAETPCNQEIDVTLPHFPEQRLRFCDHEMIHNARIASGEPAITPIPLAKMNVVSASTRALASLEQTSQRSPLCYSCAHY